MAEKVLNEIKDKTDFSELENLPETIEDIENNPILKPLLEFHKQASMLVKEDKLEHEFLVKTKDDIDEDLKTGIYDNSSIVKKYRNLTREYDRLILIYSRYTDLSDEKIIEIKKIVERYYITKKQANENMQKLRDEIEKLEQNCLKENRELKKQLKEIKEPVEIKSEPKLNQSEEVIENELENYEENEELENEELEEEEKSVDDEEDDGYEEFLKRKIPQKGAPKKVIGGKKRR